jgi:hypothetical protein
LRSLALEDSTRSPSPSEYSVSFRIRLNLVSELPDIYTKDIVVRDGVPQSPARIGSAALFQHVEQNGRRSRLLPPIKFGTQQNQLRSAGFNGRMSQVHELDGHASRGS